jgi:hypothetical protein
MTKQEARIITRALGDRAISPHCKCPSKYAIRVAQAISMAWRLSDTDYEYDISNNGSIDMLASLPDRYEVRIRIGPGGRIVQTYKTIKLDFPNPWATPNLHQLVPNDSLV